MVLPRQQCSKANSLCEFALNGHIFELRGRADLKATVYVSLVDLQMSRGGHKCPRLMNANGYFSMLENA